jgi:hypothetical protein
MYRIARALFVLPVVAVSAAACQPMYTSYQDPYWGRPVAVVPATHYRRTTMTVPVIIDSEGRVVATGRDAEMFDARTLPTTPYGYSDRGYVESRYQPVVGTRNNTVVLEGSSRRVRYLNDPW